MVERDIILDNNDVGGEAAEAIVLNTIVPEKKKRITRSYKSENVRLEESLFRVILLAAISGIVNLILFALLIIHW